jgi:hypothetical protein
LLAEGRAREGREALRDYQQLQERMTQTNSMFGGRLLNVLGLVIWPRLKRSYEKL